MTDEARSTDADDDPGVDPRLSRHGALSYLHIPAADPNRSARFYGAVFGWTIHNLDTPRPGFEDGSGSLVGAFVTDQAPSTTPGLLPYIYVEGIDAVVQAIVANGGEIVRAVAPEGNLRIATFADPAGNVLGIWESPEG
jgi:uncharacterized protein